MYFKIKNFNIYGVFCFKMTIIYRTYTHKQNNKFLKKNREFKEFYY